MKIVFRMIMAVLLLAFAGNGKPTFATVDCPPAPTCEEINARVNGTSSPGTTFWPNTTVKFTIVNPTDTDTYNGPLTDEVRGYYWTFGDNSDDHAVNVQNPTHLYQQPDHYRVTVKLNDNAFNSDGTEQPYTGQWCNDDLVEKTIDIDVVNVKIWKVTWGGGFTVAQDTGGSYGTPQWYDANLDGDANDGGDSKYPHCYQKNTAATVSARLKLYDANGWPLTVKVKGSGAHVNIAADCARVDDEIILGNTTSTPTTFPDQVRVIDAESISWSVSRDDGATWKYAGTSENEIFNTKDTTLGCSTNWRTVLYLGCKNGGTLSTVWALFSGRNVKAWKQTATPPGYERELYYYKGGATGIAENVGAMLSSSGARDGDGNCNAWAGMFKECLAVNNTSSAITTVTAPIGCYQFIVKNKNFSGSPTYGACPWEYAIGDIYETTGIAGQNRSTPAEKMFVQHFIVHGPDGYYDPSYGGGQISDESDFTYRSIAALQSSSDGHWDQSSHQGSIVRFNDL